MRIEVLDLEDRDTPHTIAAFLVFGDRGDRGTGATGAMRATPDPFWWKPVLPARWRQHLSCEQVGARPVR
ncbi:MAG: hypothetical protein IH936_08740 [Acidobacteria bacterium]|nr:hypothetical protein [Acidobacteriota bacterium]